MKIEFKTIQIEGFFLDPDNLIDGSDDEEKFGVSVEVNVMDFYPGPNGLPSSPGSIFFN